VSHGLQTSLVPWNSGCLCGGAGRAFLSMGGLGHVEHRRCLPGEILPRSPFLLLLLLMHFEPGFSFFILT
jgi:hypothetical protein